MKVYDVAASNDDGENLSLFVVAPDQQFAFRYWRAYCLENGWIEEGEYEGEIVTDVMVHMEAGYASIWELNPGTAPGVMPWHHPMSTSEPPPSGNSVYCGKVAK